MIDLLAGLESAEDFFTALGVAWEPRVLSAARLHVLRAFGALVAQIDAEGIPDGERRARYADALRRAHSVYLQDVNAARAFGGKGCAVCGDEAEACR